MSRYCDYDAIVHYQPGEFASKYADKLEEKLELTEPAALEKWEKDSFLDSKYETFITKSPVIAYRIYGKYQQRDNAIRGLGASGAQLGGRFVSTEFAESCIDVKMRLALKPEWKNTKMYEAKLIIPAGEKISVGVVAPVTLHTGTILPGGAPQILLRQEWPNTWIQGYRRVSGRQLQVEPTYWKVRPEEVAMGKEKLYPDVCPSCCYPHIRELRKDEQVVIIGSKGHSYTMKKCCLNPDCQYCW